MIYDVLAYKKKNGTIPRYQIQMDVEAIKISSIGSQQCVNKLLTSFFDRYSHSQERVPDKTN